MKNLMIDAEILQNFKNGVKAVAFSGSTYELGGRVGTIERLDDLIDTFSNAVIAECINFVRENVSLRLQIQEMALKYNMPVDFLENYIFDTPKSETKEM